MLQIRKKWRDWFALACTYFSESIARLVFETKHHSLTDLNCTYATEDYLVNKNSLNQRLALWS